MPITEVVRQFTNSNLIRETNIEKDQYLLANHYLGVNELRGLLKQNKLKLTGKKADLISRILSTYPGSLAQYLPKEAHFIATEKGCSAVASRTKRRKLQKELCELNILKLAKEKDSLEIIRIWNEFSEGEPFLSTIDASRCPREVDILAGIYHGKCLYLETRLAAQEIDALRPTAALKHICGKSLSPRTLDAIKASRTVFDTEKDGISQDVAERMLIFFACNHSRLKQLKQNGYHLVSTSCCSDSCKHCIDLSQSVASIHNAPQLPHAGCSHSMGCRCTYIPKKSGEDS